MRIIDSISDRITTRQKRIGLFLVAAALVFFGLYTWVSLGKDTNEDVNRGNEVTQFNNQLAQQIRDAVTLLEKDQESYPSSHSSRN